MQTKTLLVKRIESENAYLETLEVGSKEYNESQDRLSKLLVMLNNLEQQEKEAAEKEQQAKIDKKDRLIRNVMEGVKIGSGIVLPVVGLIGITAAERDISFTGALREYTKYFLPKKN